MRSKRASRFAPIDIVHSATSRTSSGIGYILAASVFWGTTGTAQAFAPEGAQPAVVGAARMFIGGFALLAIALTWGRADLASPWPKLATFGAACGVTIYQLCFFAGVAKTGVAVGTIVAIGSSPMFAGLFGWLLLRERPGKRWGAATALAILGCSLFALAGARLRLDPVGILAALGAGAGYAFYSVNGKRAMARHSPLAGTAVICSLAAVLLLLSALPFFLHLERKPISAREMALLSVLTALAVVSRAVFYLIPQVKPIAAVVIVAGMCLGPFSGYMVGALSAFLSNFLFGQGIWTPFQMVALGLVGLLLSGCSTVPKELAYEPADQLVAYQPTLQGMEGKPARWSGVISAVHNKADQSVIEVVYLPLKSNGVPEQTEQSPGRFLAIMQGFVDPTLYAKGRSLTVLGTLDKPVDSQIGEHKYRFSVLKVTGSKLWPPVKEVEIRYMDPYFYDPFYDPFWPRRPLRR